MQERSATDSPFRCRRGDTTFVYCGRFQPFHVGHMSVVGRAISLGFKPLIVGVIINTVESGAATTDKAIRTSNYGDAAQDPSRNPLPPLVRVELITRALKSAGLGNDVVVTVVPRPERHWEMIENLLPAPRSWILPETTDAFDHSKAEYYAEQGDKVIWLHGLNRSISGSMVRERLKNGENVASLVPESVVTDLECALGAYITESEDSGTM